jgi:hypothetical protein
VWIEDEEAVGGMKLFCTNTTVSVDGQCLDDNPDVMCWGDEHRHYIVIMLVLLVPFYMGILQLQVSAQARQSVVVRSTIFPWNCVFAYYSQLLTGTRLSMAGGALSRHNPNFCSPSSLRASAVAIRMCTPL